MLFARFVVIVFLWTLCACATAHAERIMIFAPHEDDEALGCAGVIRNAVLRGDTVTVVMVTSGDLHGGQEKARKRILQTINAMAMLGLSEENILYFGYADRTVLANAYRDPDRIFTANDGLTRQTRCFPDIGVQDYHFTVFKRHGSYTRADILSDFHEVLKRYRPHHIYMPSPMEFHPDHSVTGLFVIEALLNLKKTVTDAPVIHEYHLYRIGLPQDALTPAAYVNNSIARMDGSPYAWTLRESLAVPPEMTLPFAGGNNLKYNVLRAYPGSTRFDMDKFIKADEVFWRRDMANIAFAATVTASSENTATRQDAAGVTDGVILGYPYANWAFSLSDKEWASNRQRSGAWVRLTWPERHLIDRVVLYDRPSVFEHISAGTLTFSDGASVAVGSLPNNGSAHVVTFPARSVSWVQLTIDRAQGRNAGLSEFEVFEANIAPLADISVSSETSDKGQLGIKAVDGSIDGAPGDPTREWVTQGELDGAWIMLTFNRPYRVDRIVLYDRPNPTDRVTSGVLTFSDGSTVDVDALPNDGSGHTVTFPPRTVTWIKFTITGAEGRNIGLSECQVYGAAE